MRSDFRSSARNACSDRNFCRDRNACSRRNARRGQIARIGFVIAWFLLIGAGLGAGQAATRTFSGANLAPWSNPANWLEGAAPVDGDDVVFPASVQANSTNNIAGLDLRSITADASHRIHGNALTVSHGVVSDAPFLLRISAPLALAGHQEWSGVLFVDQLDVAGYTLTTTGGTINGLQVTSLSGAGAIVKNDLGVLMPTNAAGYTGSITANAGILQVATPDALGTSDGTAATATVINDGATLFVEASTLGEDLTLNGTGANSSSALSIYNPTGVTFTGAITLATSASVWGDGPGNPIINFAGPVSGPGDLLIFHDTRVNLASPQNSFSGRVRFIGTATGALMLGVAQSLAQTGGVDLGVFAELDLYGHNHTIPWLGGHGTVTSSNQTAGTLTIANETDATFMGAITNVTSVVKKGAGVLTLGGTSTHAGLTSIEGGTLRVTGAAALGTAAGATQVVGNTVLMLDGVSPGTESFILTRVQPTDTPTLRVTAASPVAIAGSLTLGAGSVIGGAGSGADLTVSGPIASTGDLRIAGVQLHATFNINQFQAGTVTVDADATLDIAAQGAFGSTPTKALHVMGVVTTNGPSIAVNSLTGTGTIQTAADVHVEVAPAVGTNVFPGIITGAPQLLKSAAGTLRLTGTATLGWAFVDGGELAIATQQLTSPHLIVNPGATLAWDVPMTHAGDLTMSDTGSGASTLAIRGGNVTLEGVTSFTNASSQAHVTGAHQLVLRNRIGGRRLTAYGTGVTVLDQTFNFLQEIVAGRDETSAGRGTVRLARANALDHSLGFQPTGVGVEAGSTFDLAGFSQRLTAVGGTGTMDTGTASGVLTLDGAAAIFDGTLAGPGRVAGNAAPTTYPLKGTHPLTGTFETNAALDVAANTVMPAAIVARGGIVTIESGSSLGALTLDGAAEYLRVGSDASAGGITTRGLTLPAAATTKVWLTAATPRITVNGSVALAGGFSFSTSAQLPLPAPGGGGGSAAAALTIIDNDGTDPIVGSFANLPEGSRLTIGGGEYRVSYSGGTGNDLTLTPAAEPTLMTYHLAEGATGTFFDTDLLIANPTAQGVLVDVTFLPENGAPPIVQLHFVYAMSRLTLKVDDVEGLDDASFSTIVAPREDVPLIVERTMRWDASGYGGHTEKATEGPATTWYFAEGAEGFSRTFLLLANPDAAANVAHVQYLREGLPSIARSYDLLPSSRRTIAAGDDAELIGQAFGMTVTFDRPGVAERAMYFGTSPIFRGGHESAGVTAASPSWLLAEGATGAGFETFILTANPGSEAADVTFTFLPENGAPVSIVRRVEAASRITINPESDPELATLPIGPVATQITATKPVIAERAQYWPLGPADWTEAHNSFGVTDAAVKWGLAEGRAGGPEGYQTYILLANPGMADAKVTLTFLGDRATANATAAAAPAPVTRIVDVPAQRRVNVAVDPTGAAGDPAATFGTLITSDQPIVVERAMYWNVNGEVWAAGTNATATRLP
jgi:autotransporter-associated beta strand protein